MRALYLDGYGVRLGASKGALVVRGREGERYIPLSEVDLVVVASSGVSVSSRAMRLLTAAGVEMVVLDYRGYPVGVYYASSYTRTPATRRAQYLAYYNGAGVRLAVEIAYSKVYNQACILQDLLYANRRVVRESIERMRTALDMLDGLRDRSMGLDAARGKIMNIEAHAAHVYWSTIAAVLPGDLGFQGRSQEPIDPVNASLNYGYGILYGLSWRALVLAGLDPYAGFLHSDRSGKPTLSFDYVEMFRAHVVDKPLIDLFHRGWKPGFEAGRLDNSSRKRVAEAVFNGLKRKINGEPLEGQVRVYALRLAKALRDGVDYAGFRGCRLR